MEKSVILQVEELRNKIIEDINGSKLHITLIRALVDELKRDIDMQYEMMYRQELKNYEEGVEE